MEQLKKRGFQLASKSPLCGNAEEDLDHLLLHYTEVWGLWAALLSLPGLQWVCPYLVKDLLQGWNDFPIRKSARKVWRAAPLSLNWAILELVYSLYTWGSSKLFLFFLVIYCLVYL